MQSKAATVEQYLAELPSDRREAIQAVRQVILKNLDKGFEEGMQYGMIGYYVPHRLFPAGYHCDPSQPLPFGGLASQKNHMSIYLMSNYDLGIEGKWFRAAWAKSGKKLDMGKCCIRFRKLDDLALDVIGEAVRRVSVSGYIANYEEVLRGRSTNVKKPRATAPKKKTASSPTKKSTKASNWSSKSGSPARSAQSTRKKPSARKSKSGAR